MNPKFRLRKFFDKHQVRYKKRSSANVIIGTKINLNLYSQLAQQSVNSGLVVRVNRELMTRPVDPFTLLASSHLKQSNELTCRFTIGIIPRCKNHRRIYCHTVVTTLFYLFNIKCVQITIVSGQVLYFCRKSKGCFFVVQSIQKLAQQEVTIFQSGT